MRCTQKTMLKYTFSCAAWKEIQNLVFHRLKNVRINRIVAKLNEAGNVDCELHFPYGTDEFNCEANKMFQDCLVKAMQNKELDTETSAALNYALANCCQPVFKTIDGE